MPTLNASNKSSNEVATFILRHLTSDHYK